MNKVNKLFLVSWTMAISALGAAAEATTSTLDVTNNSVQKKEGGTNLILLGTAGGPIIRSYRSQPATLLIVNGKRVLVDCGEGTVRQLQRIGLGPEAVSTLFFTHLHFDHTAGLASLLAFDWAGNNSRAIDIYGPPGTDVLVKSAINYFAIPMEIFRPMLKRPDLQQLVSSHTFEVVGPKVVYEDENMTVTAVENSHYKTVKLGAMPYGTARSYSYRFKTKDRTIFFTGDTGPSEAVTQLASGADILVSEIIDINQAMRDAQSRGGSEQGVAAVIAHQKQEHLTPQEVGKMATTANVKMVVLTHLAFASDSEGRAASFIEGVRETYSGPVIAGRDFDEF
jgi:ribonuclease BN (tRNA processing enzyme)